MPDKNAKSRLLSIEPPAASPPQRRLWLAIAAIGMLSRAQTTLNNKEFS